MSIVLLGYGVAVFPGTLHGFAQKLAIAMVAMLFAVGAPFSVRMATLNANLGWHEIKQSLYVACPRWMRLGAFALLVVGLALFYLPAVLDVLDIGPHNDGAAMPSTAPGGFGIILFSQMFAQLYSAKMRPLTQQEAKQLGN